MDKLLKIISKEFLWGLITLVLAAPLSFFFMSGLDLVSKEENFTENEKIFVLELFFIIYIFNFIGIYLIRFIYMAIRTLAKKE